ncbi:ABC transporter substrate-binding protein [Nonomuraea soli]|uniref:Raffinose/stachyose/melibiose transport system substrate-binding protein n=1 Tax=Nonomuraea soli TaxID=1032476 RepID=A0A7W0CG58_9ACTN|nr:ABC transporter substrate-binding protein [Nonomuraea soli]MBA2890345.1 raffinose/stachyose/melibiose transport system substrate-binding protein [Nonomuraea soli]
MSPISSRLAAGALVLGLVTACGGDPAPQGAAQAASKELVYWSMWKQGEPQQVALQAAIERFTKDTGIKVSVEWAGRDVVKQKLPAALTTSKVPDVVDQSDDTIRPFMVTPGVARGLGKVYEADVPGEPGKKVKDVIPAKYTQSPALKLASGEPYMVPYSVAGIGLFYDAAALPEVAAAPPKDWASFTALLDRLKAGGAMAPITADGEQYWSDSYWMNYYLYRTIGADGLKAVAEDRTGEAWRKPEVLAAAQQIEKFARQGYLLKGYDASKYPEQQKNWAQNKAAFMIMGSWLPGEVGTYAKPGFKPASMPFPKVGGPAQGEEVVQFGFAMPTKAKNVEAGERFIAHLTSKTFADDLARTASVLSPREDAVVPEALAGLKKQLDGVAATYPFAAGLSVPGWADKVYYSTLGELFNGKLSAQEFVDKIAGVQAEFWKNQGN